MAGQVPHLRSMHPSPRPEANKAFLDCLVLSRVQPSGGGRGGEGVCVEDQQSGRHRRRGAVPVPLG
jgi:hypothetical protein